MSDDDAIGIYAKNNNTSAASNDYKVTNTGTIEVKNQFLNSNRYLCR